MMPLASQIEMCVVQVEWFKLGKVIVGTNDDRFYIKVMGNLENFHHC